MLLYTNAKLVAVEAGGPFNDKDGNPIVYFINSLRIEGTGIVELNSKSDYAEMEGEQGIACIRARKLQDGPGYKLTLAAFKVGEELEEPENEIN